jgi:excisionase family DNA binding protein
MTDPDDRLLSYKELADKLGIAVPTLRRLVRKKKIPCINMGHQIVRFHYPSVLKILNKNPTD